MLKTKQGSIAYHEWIFGGSLKTHTKFVRLESVRVGHIDTLDTHSPVGAAPYI